MKSSEHLVAGQRYSRENLREMFAITDATINTGIFRPGGHDSVWLFVTEDKPADRTQYQDHLEGDDLRFEGQTAGRTDSLIRDHRERGLELLLFHRGRKDEHADYSFRYEGRFEFVSERPGTPTAFHLRRSREPSPVKYWAFVCNPDYYDGLTAVNELEAINWTVDRGAPQVGDKAIIWKAKGREAHRGVIALAEVIEPKRMRPESDDEIRYWRADQTNDEPRCRLRILAPCNPPLWEAQHGDILSALNPARARGGTVFTLTPDEWAAISERAQFDHNEQPESQQESQGFIANPIYRRAVERYAEEKAMDHFRNLQFEVERVGDRESYDLHCRRGAEEVHVEVKGTTGRGDAVFLTRNEVAHARAHRTKMALAVVSQIVVDAIDGEVHASGGELCVIWPWDIDLGELTPIQFQYRPPA